MIKLKNSLWICLGLILVLLITGCTTSSAVTVDIHSISQNEKNELIKEAFQSLEAPIQNEIINWEQAQISTFKADHAFEIYKNNIEAMTVNKDLQTIVVTFNGKEESIFHSLKVYLDENNGKALGYFIEEK